MPRSRGEVKVQLIKDPKQRGVAFRKRRFGVMKKAYELSVMTECEVLVVVMKDEKIYQFGSQPVNYFKQRFADATSIEENCSPSDIINEVHEAKKRKSSNSSNLSEDDHFAEATAMFEKRCKLQERCDTQTWRNSNEVSSTSMPSATDKVSSPFALQSLPDKKPSTTTKEKPIAHFPTESPSSLVINNKSASIKTRRPLPQLTLDNFSVLEMRPTSLPGTSAPQQNEFGLVMDPEDSDTSDASSLSEVTSGLTPSASFHDFYAGPKTVLTLTDNLASSADSLLTPEPHTMDPVLTPFCTIENVQSDSTSVTDQTPLSPAMTTVVTSWHSPLTVNSSVAPAESDNQNISNASASNRRRESDFVTLTTPAVSRVPTNHVTASVKTPMKSEQRCSASSSLHPSSPSALECSTTSSPKVNPPVQKLSLPLQTRDSVLSL